MGPGLPSSSWSPSWLVPLVPLVLLGAGCGRIGFGTAGPDGAVEGENPDALVDAGLLDGGQVTVSFGENPAAQVNGGTRDTFLSNETGEASLNYGTADELRIEEDVSEQALLAFDLSTISPSATVIRAALQLTIVQANPTANIAIHPVVEAWQQGAGDGTADTASFFNRLPNVPWTTPGAEPPGSAALVVTSFRPSPATTVAVGLPPGLVQGWVDDPSSNHGVVFLSDSGETSRLASSEASPESARPMLLVTYQP